ncbi:MAG: transporter substrate-binding domain-containing protein [Candidatus Aminicenantes bacterium]|nr:MAG: transporter substrate-binding domain-containing protein [Candidatus Aminicenantes bacterium]
MTKKHRWSSKTFMVMIIFLITLVVPQLVFSNDAGTEPGSTPEEKTSKLERIKASGKLVVGTSADYPPYEFHLLDDKEGDLVGIDIDIAKVIADELGVKLEVKDLIFSRIFKALESGQIDIAIAGLSPTEARKEVASFSDIYYQAIQCVIIHKDNAERIKTIEDLRGKKVGVQKDSIQEDMAKGQIHGADFDVRETIEELIIILDKGLVDGIILEKPVGDSYVHRNKNFTSLRCEEKFNEMLGSAIAVKKGDAELLKEINRILAKLKKEGKIDEFVETAKMLSNKR